VSDDDHDGAGDGDQGLELAAAFDQASIAFAEEGVGLGGRGVVVTKVRPDREASWRIKLRPTPRPESLLREYR
jgi:hypothetical protein